MAVYPWHRYSKVAEKSLQAEMLWLLLIKKTLPSLGLYKNISALWGLVLFVWKKNILKAVLPSHKNVLVKITIFVDALIFLGLYTQQTQSIYITFVQTRPNVFDVGPIL